MDKAKDFLRWRRQRNRQGYRNQIGYDQSLLVVPVDRAMERSYFGRYSPAALAWTALGMERGE